MRNRVILACTECKQRNYTTMKNKQHNPIVLSSASTARSAKSTPCTRKPSKGGLLDYGKRKEPCAGRESEEHRRYR